MSSAEGLSLPARASGSEKCWGNDNRRGGGNDDSKPHLMSTDPLLASALALTGFERALSARYNSLGLMYPAFTKHVLDLPD